MKRKFIIFTISICAFFAVNAHNPSSDSLDVYIDNIFVGKRSCIDFNKIPSVLLEHYYCGYLFKCPWAEFMVKDPFSIMNPKRIRQIYIEKNSFLSTSGVFHIRTKKAKDGYLFVNKLIMDKVANLNCELDKIKISYVYNNKAITTKKDVMRVLGLREKCIQISEIIQDKQLGMITVYIIDKK